MKNYILIAMAAGGLALAAPAAAEKDGGPCAADAAKFCKDVKPGEGRVAACLKEHAKELSQACTDKRAKAAEKRAARREKFARMKGGRGGVCMREYGQGFGAGFRSGYRMHGKLGRAEKTAKAKRNKLVKVCAADIGKLCEGVKPGEGRVRDCLIKNLDKLSEGCKARTGKIKAKLEEKSKKV
jgi:hypothetical protein